MHLSVLLLVVVDIDALAALARVLTLTPTPTLTLPLTRSPAPSCARRRALPSSPRPATPLITPKMRKTQLKSTSNAQKNVSREKRKNA